MAHLGQVANVIGVEQQLLETAGIPEDVFGHGRQGAVALVHELHLPIATLEYWNALEHGSEELIPHKAPGKAHTHALIQVFFSTTSTTIHNYLSTHWHGTG